MLATALIGLAVVAMSALCVPAAAAAPERGRTCDAVAHHEDANHSGASCTTLPASATQRWSVTLNGTASYPIIAEGKVFVTTASTSGSDGWLYALDAATGAVAWGPIPLAQSDFYSSLAYDDGLLFVNNFNGAL